MSVLPGRVAPRLLKVDLGGPHGADRQVEVVLAVLSAVVGRSLRKDLFQVERGARGWSWSERRERICAKSREWEWEFPQFIIFNSVFFRGRVMQKI